MIFFALLVLLHPFHPRKKKKMKQVAFVLSKL
jgi:hypothetical protein